MPIAARSYRSSTTGQLTSTTDEAGRRIDNAYDSLDRLTTQIWYNSDAGRQSWRHDELL
jgi:YD repeat-containing protein